MSKSGEVYRGPKMPLLDMSREEISDCLLKVKPMEYIPAVALIFYGIIGTKANGDAKWMEFMFKRGDGYIAEEFGLALDYSFLCDLLIDAGMPKEQAKFLTREPAEGWHKDYYEGMEIGVATEAEIIANEQKPYGPRYTNPHSSMSQGWE